MTTVVVMATKTMTATGNKGNNNDNKGYDNKDDSNQGDERGSNDSKWQQKQHEGTQ
jgi:hypothetical protein